jgi:hypothetical protein
VLLPIAPGAGWLCRSLVLFIEPRKVFVGYSHRLAIGLSSASLLGGFQDCVLQEFGVLVGLAIRPPARAHRRRLCFFVFV